MGVAFGASVSMGAAARRSGPSVLASHVETTRARSERVPFAEVLGTGSQPWQNLGPAEDRTGFWRW